MRIPVEHLRAAGLGDEVEKLSMAVATYLDENKSLTGGGSNVAVVSDPFAGRESLLDYAEELLDDARRVSFSSAIESEDEIPSVPEDRALIVDNCHYLYQRRIDGFDVLESFLSELANTNTLVITSWNRYSWNYLDAVRSIGESFPRQIRIPELETEQIEAVVNAHTENDPKFVDTGEAGRIKTIDVFRHPVSVWRDRTVEVPLVKPNPEWFISWTDYSDEREIEAVVYEKLRLTSHGNPGIATSFWDESVRKTEQGPEIAPAYIRDPVQELDLGDDSRAFLLFLLVSMEEVERDILEKIMDDTIVDKSLQPLVDMGILSMDADKVRLEPAGLHPSIGELRRKGLLW